MRAKNIHVLAWILQLTAIHKRNVLLAFEVWLKQSWALKKLKEHYY